MKHSSHLSTSLVLASILFYKETGARSKDSILKWLLKLSAKTLIVTPSPLQILLTNHVKFQKMLKDEGGWKGHKTPGQKSLIAAVHFFSVVTFENAHGSLVNPPPFPPVPLGSGSLSSLTTAPLPVSELHSWSQIAANSYYQSEGIGCFRRKGRISDIMWFNRSIMYVVAVQGQLEHIFCICSFPLFLPTPLCWRISGVIKHKGGNLLPWSLLKFSMVGVTVGRGRNVRYMKFRVTPPLLHSRGTMGWLCCPCVSVSSIQRACQNSLKVI